MKKRILSILALVIALVLVFTACSGEKATDGNAEKPAVSQSDEKTEDKKSDSDNPGVFGAFESVDLDGKKVDYTALQGKKLTMVNIWATFCGPCINEMPDLQKISQEYADNDFQIVGIVCDVTQTKDGSFSKALKDEAEKIVKQTKVGYKNILMSDSLVASEAGQVYSVPTTYFLDENGNRVGQTYIGSRSYADWCSIIDGLLSE